MRYANRTAVSVTKSRIEVERTLSRYGAKAFAFKMEDTQAKIVFDIRDRRILFELPLPDPNERRFTHTPSGKARKATQSEREWEQACRQRWRALALSIKSKLEAIESGISSFEREFLAFIMLPDGGTVGSFVEPQIEEVYRTGGMPKLLTEGGDEEVSH